MITQEDNSYYNDLRLFYERLIVLRHNAYFMNNMMNATLKSYSDVSPEHLISASALVISDITGVTDNGWDINFHTGISKSVFANGFNDEVARLISVECCYVLAQSFEALEKLFKNFVYEKCKLDDFFSEDIKTEKINPQDRVTYPGGESLLKLIRKATKENFNSYSESNNYRLKFSVFWKTISELRHAVTHSQNIIKNEKIFKSNDYTNLARHFASFNPINENESEILLDYKKIDRLIKSIAEFAYQVFKILSIERGFEWKIA